MKSFKKFIIEQQTKDPPLIKRTEDEISVASTYDFWPPQRIDTDNYNTSDRPAFSGREDRTLGDLSKLGYSRAIAAEYGTPVGGPSIEKSRMIQQKERKGIPPIGAAHVESLRRKMQIQAQAHHAQPQAQPQTQIEPEPHLSDFKTFEDYKGKWWDWFGRGGINRSGYDPEKFNVNDLETIDATLQKAWDESETSKKIHKRESELWVDQPGRGREPLG